jgi:hypothetical protein
MKTSFVILGLIAGLCFPAVCQAGDVFISGLAPDWNQPLDYPDLFDPNNGPLAGDVFWNAWCAPTTAAMLVGYWEDMLNRNGLADGSADDNQFAIPPGYGGPAFGMGAAWHDYTADGIAGGMGGNGQRPFRPIKDHGWYMDTNGTGCNAIPKVGTWYKDVAPGLNSFFAAVGQGGGQPAQNLSAATLGVHPFFGGWTVAQLAGFIKTEINNDRVVIAHFMHWSLNLQKTAKPGDGTEDSEDDFDLEVYTFNANNPGGGGHGEVWNNSVDEYGLGHAVLVVGYSQDNNGNVTDVIVHDNWPSTERNVKVPVGAQLAAVTRARGFSLIATPYPLIPGAYGEFSVRDGASHTPTWLGYSLTGPGYTFIPQLGVAMDIDNPRKAGGSRTTDHDGYTSWTLPIPTSMPGMMVWLQALQPGEKTNVVETFIR